MKDFIYSLGDSFVDFFSEVFFDDSGNCNTFGSCLLAFSGVMLCLGLILKIFKILSLRYKKESSLDETIESKKVDCDEPFVSVSSHKVPLVSHFSCVYCGSMSTTNFKNCRNCGSDEFVKVGD